MARRELIRTASSSDNPSPTVLSDVLATLERSTSAPHDADTLERAHLLKRAQTLGPVKVAGFEIGGEANGTRESSVYNEGTEAALGDMTLGALDGPKKDSNVIKDSPSLTICCSVPIMVD